MKSSSPSSLSICSSVTKPCCWAAPSPRRGSSSWTSPSSFRSPFATPPTPERARPQPCPASAAGARRSSRPARVPPAPSATLPGSSRARSSSSARFFIRTTPSTSARSGASMRGAVGAQRRQRRPYLGRELRIAQARLGRPPLRGPAAGSRPRASRARETTPGPPPPPPRPAAPGARRARRESSSRAPAPRARRAPSAAARPPPVDRARSSVPQSAPPPRSAPDGSRGEPRPCPGRRSSTPRASARASNAIVRAASSTRRPETIGSSASAASAAAALSAARADRPPRGPRPALRTRSGDSAASRSASTPRTTAARTSVSGSSPAGRSTTTRRAPPARTARAPSRRLPRRVAVEDRARPRHRAPQQAAWSGVSAVPEVATVFPIPAWCRAMASK